MPRGKRTENAPFEGDPPAVGPGDEVWCRTAAGQWIRKVARSAPRYDRENAWHSIAYLTVAVSSVEEWASYGDDADWLNWPAGDVVPGDRPAPGRTYQAIGP